MRCRWRSLASCSLRVANQVLFVQILQSEFRAPAARFAINCRQPTQVRLTSVFLQLVQKLLSLLNPCPPAVCGIRMQVSKRAPLRIECARVGGVEIPNQKFIEYSLQYIFGVGHTTAKAILVETVSQYQHISHRLGCIFLVVPYLC